MVSASIYLKLAVFLFIPCTYISSTLHSVVQSELTKY